MSSAGSHHASPWRWRSVLLLAFLIFHWYLFSYFFNANLKTWFKLHKQGNEDVIFPLLFSIFLSNTAASALWVAYASGRRGCDALSGTCLSQLVFGFKLDFTLLCASGVVGIAATVLVLEHGSIQLVQIARSVGPLFTSLWAYLVLNQPTTGLPLVCLATTLGGTILASWQEPSFCTATAILMFTVNATLTFRNAATKKIISHFHGYSPSLIASALLALTSAAGLLLVTALWFVCLMMGRSAMLPRDLTTHRQLFVLGGCNFAYNLASQIVLANVAVVSHGMLELFKRVFVLVAASVMLQVRGARVGVCVKALGWCVCCVTGQNAGRIVDAFWGVGAVYAVMQSAHTTHIAALAVEHPNPGSAAGTNLIDTNFSGLHGCMAPSHNDITAIPCSNRTLNGSGITSWARSLHVPPQQPISTSAPATSPLYAHQALAAEQRRP